MLFFQVGLLLGYSYSHVLAHKLPLRKQAYVHLAALAASLLLLPITPSQAFLPSAGDDPTMAILRLLGVSVGVPFVLISATAPLLQHWFANVNPNQSPFRLYALSNAGSLLALLSYPFLVEPNLPLTGQTTLWAFGYGGFFFLCVWCALPILRGLAVQTVTAGTTANKVGMRDRLLWVALAACGSTALLAVTNQMSQDVAVVPFLWIVPLSLYLISFIICFDRDAWYVRRIWLPFLLVSVGLVVYLMLRDYGTDEMYLVNQIIIYSAAAFGCFMVCHGELVRRRSAVSELTSFYLYVAVGGALGGVLVNLVAPYVFNGYWEMHLMLLTTFVLTGACVWSDRDSFSRPLMRRLFGVASIVSIGVLGHFLSIHVSDQQRQAIDHARSFYGVLHVYEYNIGMPNQERVLHSGRIQHGSQTIGGSAAVKAAPTTYYGIKSGVGLSIRQHPKRKSKDPNGLRIGAVGLGVGTIAAHVRKADSIRFYEINPQVLEFANKYFTYLNPEKNIEVALGDARITLQQELDDTGSQQFDILAVDAFSGDAIPVHLLTAEAMDLYWQHLTDDGILALHLTNFHLDLLDVARNLAERSGKQAFWIDDEGGRAWESSSDWVLITSNPKLTGSNQFKRLATRWKSAPSPVIWTDDFSNLFDVLMW